MKHYDPLAGVKPAWPYRAIVANSLGWLVASEPRPSSPRFYLWTPDFLQGCLDKIWARKAWAGGLMVRALFCGSELQT